MRKNKKTKITLITSNPWNTEPFAKLDEEAEATIMEIDKIIQRHSVTVEEVAERTKINTGFYKSLF